LRNRFAPRSVLREFLRSALRKKPQRVAWNVLQERAFGKSALLDGVVEQLGSYAAFWLIADLAAITISHHAAFFPQV